MKNKIIALALAFLTLFPMLPITNVKAEEKELPYHEKIDNPNYEYIIYEYKSEISTAGYLRLIIAPKGYEFQKLGEMNEIWSTEQSRNLYVVLQEVELYELNVTNNTWDKKGSVSGTSYDGKTYIRIYYHGGTTFRIYYSSVNLYDLSGGVVVSKKPVTDSAKLMEMAKTQAVVKMGESLTEDFGIISVVGGLIFGTLFLVALVRRLTLLGNH